MTNNTYKFGSSNTDTYKFGSSNTDIDTLAQIVDEHIHRTDNPHSVKRADIGLDRVDNTSDDEKPISVPQKDYVDNLSICGIKIVKAEQTETTSTTPGKVVIELLNRSGDIVSVDTFEVDKVAHDYEGRAFVSDYGSSLKITEEGNIQLLSPDDTILSDLHLPEEISSAEVTTTDSVKLTFHLSAGKKVECSLEALIDFLDGRFANKQVFEDTVAQLNYAIDQLSIKEATDKQELLETITKFKADITAQEEALQTNVDKEIAQLRADIDATFGELTSQYKTLLENYKAKIDGLVENIQSSLDREIQDRKDAITSVRTDTNAAIADVRTDVNASIALLSTTLTNQINTVQKSLQSNIDHLQSDVEQYQTTTDAKIATEAQERKLADVGDLVISGSTSSGDYRFVIKDKAGNILADSIINIPVDSVVVDGKYDSATKSLILTVRKADETTKTITIPVGDLISGLATTDELNKVKSDLTTLINQETADRSTAIAKEVTDRKAQDSVLESEINTNTNAINKEVSARESADSNLEKEIADEATARKKADVAEAEKREEQDKSYRDTIYSTISQKFMSKFRGIIYSDEVAQSLSAKDDIISGQFFIVNDDIAISLADGTYTVAAGKRLVAVKNGANKFSTISLTNFQDYWKTIAEDTNGEYLVDREQIEVKTYNIEEDTSIQSEDAMTNILSDVETETGATEVTTPLTDEEMNETLNSFDISGSAELNNDGSLINDDQLSDIITSNE